MSKTGYYMYMWDETGLEQFVASDSRDRHLLIAWCKEELGYCDWHAVGDHGNNKISTVYAFRSLIDAMAFKLRWKE